MRGLQMSRKMTKSYLSRDEISLLIHSEEPKNTKLYGNLYEILLQIKELKAITLEELENRNLDYYGISALSYNKNTLIGNTTKEWRATTDIIDNSKRNARCQLCNAPKLRYECHIRNIKNNKELLVGSECVNKFKIDGYIEQEKQLKDIKKGQKIVQRRNQFYIHFPNYEEFISDAEKSFSTLPILLSFDLYSDLQNVIKRMRVITTMYINEGKKPYKSEYDSFELFQLAINQYNKLKIKSDEYVSANISKKFICKRMEIDWLVSQNKLNLLEKISRNKGIYTLSTLQGIYSISFVQQYISLISAKSISNNMKFEKFSGNNIIFSFHKFGYSYPILFSASLKDFMKQIGAICIIEDDFTYTDKNILSISHIINIKRNLFSILEYIDDIMKTLNCAFLIDDASNSLYLYRKGDKSVRQFSKYNFMQNYSKYVLLSDEKIKNHIEFIVRGNKNIKWITPKIQEKQDIDEKIGMLYKAYKESHNY